MPVVNTEYDLLYNTDGNSVITIRDDKIPFAGVKSFAVESATKNYFGRDAWEFDSEQALFYPHSLASGKTWADCWDEKQKAYVGGQGITATNIYSVILNLGQVYAAGTKIALSWKHKGMIQLVHMYYSATLVPRNEMNIYSSVPEFHGDVNYMNTSGNLLINGISPSFSGQPEKFLNRWYNIEIIYTLPADAQYISIRWHFYGAYQSDNGRGVPGYIHKPQLEVKPFASSFVAGSRPDGRYVIPTEKLGFDIANDNWVVTYMKYPIATQDKSQTHQNLCSFGQATGDNSKGYISWGKKNNENKYCVNLVLDNSTVVSATSETTIVPANYFYKWHHEVIKREGNTISYYVDGIKQVTATIPSDRSLKTPFDVGLVMGGIVSSATHYPHNSLISNLAYGRLQTGEFSDSYIAFLASANKLFAAKPKSQIY